MTPVLVTFIAIVISVLFAAAFSVPYQIIYWELLNATRDV